MTSTIGTLLAHPCPYFGCILGLFSWNINLTWTTKCTNYLWDRYSGFI